MNNQELLSRRDKALPRGAATALPVFVHKALGSEIWDVEGNHYVDFASGIAVNNTGNLHPKIVAAIESQLKQYAHIGFPVLSCEPFVRLCERLNDLAPIDDAKSTLFTTGAEAMENAVKVARFYKGRQGIITFTGSFHGRTQLALAMTGKVLPLRMGVTPSQAGIFQIPFPIPHHGTTEQDSLKALDHLFRATISPDQVAAIVIEPVQGEGGFYQASPVFLQTLRKICDEHGICLVVDEVQSGFGRTGKFFAIEHADVQPDLIAIGKAMGGGLPLSGLIGRSEIIDCPPPGFLGGTFAGNPLACAAANAVLDIIESERLLDRANQIGQTLQRFLIDLKKTEDVLPLGDIRGLGAMVAFEIVSERCGNTPDAEATKRVAAKAKGLGLLLLPCGYYGNTIRISAPLTISDDVLETGLSRLAGALKA
ncbi:4-aminobutyrate--2-oxoglutarate transaminase [Pseudomonas ogarae]|uniref:aspartate aminotransferase family protein n=1 Tax=Pseudomonas ogarae (strain DSM 112162 / CECT 30235 / F113) TaxID=1114970 RepID=UPI0009A2CDA8|nr:aspartate aminotransferase family protein [Pseudomonas ogarae]OPG72058.1 4-aminobutyrate--2-oxoglutarate transaminase [Pseudomonas ogarae]